MKNSTLKPQPGQSRRAGLWRPLLTLVCLLAVCAGVTVISARRNVQAQANRKGRAPVQGKDLSGYSQSQDPATLEEMSSAARNLLERKYGRTYTKFESATGLENGDPTAKGTPTRDSAYANPLVNDPTTDTTAQDTQSETTVALGSGNNVISAFNDSGSNLGSPNNHFTGYSTSANSATSWTDRGRLPDTTNGDAGDPILAVNRTTGRVYMTTLQFSGVGIATFRSDDNGATFAAPVNAMNFGTGSDFWDKEWVTVDNFPGTGNGNVYVVSRLFPGTGGSPATRGGCWFSRSTDNGDTFSTPIQLTGTDSGTTLPSGQGAFVTVGPDHSVYFFYYNSGTPRTITMRKSTDGGSTFGAGVTVATLVGTGTNGNLGLDFRSNSFPQVAVNPVSGNLYAVYNDDPAGADQSNVFMAQSTDGGTTWATPVQINADSTLRAQFFPTICVSPDGTRLFSSWYDRRRAASDTGLIEYWGRTATISGGTVTFGTEFRIADGSPPVFGVDPVINATYMGDYDMSVADNTAAYVTFNDQRDNSTFTGANRKNQNVRSARIPFATAGTLTDIGLGTRTVTTGTIEVNDCNLLNINLDGVSGTATGVSATLSTTTPGVTVTQATSAYADIAGGASVTNTTPFQISTDNTVACGSTINLTLSVTFTGGSASFPFTLPVTAGSDGINYQFASTTGATIPAGGTLVSGSATDDAVVTTTTPFAFSVYGTSVTAGQTITLSTNGNVQFVAAGGSTSLTNVQLPGAIFPNVPVVLPYWDDLILTTPGGGIYTNTVGTAPNRQFVVEWRGRRFGDGATTQNLNFAVVFNEGSNQFEFRYVQTGIGIALNGLSATVGVQAANSGTTFTQFSFNTSSLSAGQQLTASIPPAGCPTGGGACSVGGGCGTPSVINSLVSFTGSGSLQAPTCGAQGYSNDYVLNGTITNISSQTLCSLSLQLVELAETGGVPPAVPFRLISADGATCSTGGLPGAVQTISTPATLAPGQSANVVIRVAIPTARRYRLTFNVGGGIQSGGSTAIPAARSMMAANAPLSFEVENGKAVRSVRTTDLAGVRAGRTTAIRRK